MHFERILVLCSALVAVSGLAVDRAAVNNGKGVVEDTHVALKARAGGAGQTNSVASACGVEPAMVYDGNGAAKGAPIALKIGNGGAGQSGLIEGM